MQSNEQFNFESPKSPKKFPQMLTDPAHSIAVYTILCVLRGMKTQLCLEAMLEYMDEYLQTVEKHNPKLKNAVSVAMSRVSIKQIYKDAML
jgi:hypothetical protein